MVSGSASPLRACCLYHRPHWAMLYAKFGKLDIQDESDFEALTNFILHFVACSNPHQHSDTLHLRLFIEEKANVFSKLISRCASSQDLTLFDLNLPDNHEEIQDYLDRLKVLIDNQEQALANIFLPALNEIADQANSVGKLDEIKTAINRLLLLIAACQNATISVKPSSLAPVITAIIHHKGSSNIPYLLKGFASLIHSPPEVQAIFLHPDITGKNQKGGAHLALAPLGLIPLLQAKKLSIADFKSTCYELQAKNNSYIRKKLKDRKVLPQWFEMLEQLTNYQPLHSSSISEALHTLTANKEEGLLDKVSAIIIAIKKTKKGLSLSDFFQEKNKLH